MNRFVKFVYDVYKNNMRLWETLLLMIPAGILVIQFSTLTGYLEKNASTQSIVLASDDDAGNAISVGLRTQIWNDNKWRPYGPVYYRIAALVKYFAKDPLRDSALDAEQLREKNMHYILMVVSLLALFLTSFCLSRFFTNDLFLQLVSTATVASAFLSNSTWVTFVYRAHPDHVFALFVAIATSISLYWLKNRENDKLLKFAAITWGITASTKMTTLLFSPALLLLLFPWQKRNVRTFMAVSLAGFFLIGFPQNFSLASMFSFLVKQSAYVRTFTLDSIAEWRDLFQAQLWRPILAISVLILISPEKPFLAFREQKKILAHACLFLLTPSLVLLSRNVLSPHDYYTIPFVVSLLICFGILLQNVFSLEWRRQISTAYLLQPLGRILLLILFSIFFTMVPDQMGQTLQEQLTCRSEAKIVEDYISKLAHNGGIVITDPYVPIPSKYSSQIRRNWAPTLQFLAEKNPSAIVLHSRFYARFFEPEKPVYVKELKPVQEFYNLFRNRDSTTDQNGNIWTKTYSDECYRSIWQKNKMK